MLKNDYIMRMILDLVMTIRKVWNMPELDKDDAMDDIEESVARAVNIDRGLLFSLEPESMVSMLEIGDFDDELASYVSRALFIEVKMLEAEGRLATADLRRKQAIAIAEKYGCSIPDSAESAEGLMRTFVEDFSDGSGNVEERGKNEDAASREDRLAEYGGASSIGGIPVDKLKF